MNDGANIERLAVPLCDFGKPIAIIAGGGTIPFLIANFIETKAGSPFIFAVKNNADNSLRKFDHCEISTGEIGRLISILRKKNIKQACFVGSINARPKLKDFRPDLATLKLAASIFKGLRRGDDNLLSALVNSIEAEGVKVFGAHEIMPSLLAPAGNFFGRKPSRTMLASIECGVIAAQMLGSLDAGQGCVVIDNRIVALEGAEGTDQMLERVADLRAQGRLPNKRGGVLVKISKPQQEHRVDLPTIGVTTIENANRAQLAGIAVSAGSSLIVDIETVSAMANDAGMFIHGVTVNAARNP